MAVDVLYPDKSIEHGTGSMSADGTTGQFMKLSGSDEYAPQLVKDGEVIGILKEDRLSGAQCTIIMSGLVEVETVNGSVSAGDEVEPGADGFPTKLTTGTPRAKVIDATEGAYILRLYNGRES